MDVRTFFWCLGTRATIVSCVAGGFLFLAEFDVRCPDQTAVLPTFGLSPKDFIASAGVRGSFIETAHLGSIHALITVTITGLLRLAIARGVHVCYA